MTTIKRWSSRNLGISDLIITLLLSVVIAKSSDTCRVNVLTTGEVQNLTASFVVKMAMTLSIATKSYASSVMKLVTRQANAGLKALSNATDALMLATKRLVVWKCGRPLPHLKPNRCEDVLNVERMDILSAQVSVGVLELSLNLKCVIIWMNSLSAKASTKMMI